MGDSGSMMAVSMGINAASSATSAYSQSQAMKAQGDYQRQQYNINADLNDQKAKDAVDIGNKNANAISRKAAQIKGEQRVAAAASGVNVDTGSAGDLQSETTQMSEIDKMTTRVNAWRDAWGYKTAANDMRSQGAMAYRSAQNDARSTMLTGGLQALSYGLQGVAYANKNTKSGNDLVKDEKRRIVAEYDNRYGPKKSTSWPGLETSSKNFGVKY